MFHNILTSILAGLEEVGNDSIRLCDPLMFHPQLSFFRVRRNQNAIYVGPLETYLNLKKFECYLCRAAQNISGTMCLSVHIIQI